MKASALERSTLYALRFTPYGRTGGNMPRSTWGRKTRNGVGVAVGVRVGVLVLVGVGVAVDVGVRVGVHVWVGVGAGPRQELPVKFTSKAAY